MADLVLKPTGGGGGGLTSGQAATIAQQQTHSGVEYRNNNTRNVAPTGTEFPSPTNGDDAVVGLADGTLEFWEYTTTWTLAKTLEPSDARSQVTTAPTEDANTLTVIPDAFVGGNTQRLGTPIDWAEVQIEKPAGSGTFVTRKVPTY